MSWEVAKYLIVGGIIMLLWCVFLFVVLSMAKKEAEAMDEKYNEATKWYNSLTEAQKVEIMDKLWDMHPTIKYGKKFMISIYNYYTTKKDEE